MRRVEERSVQVPVLVGLPAARAHDVALDAEVLAVDQDPSHHPAMPGTVTAQDPEAGSDVTPGQRVAIWVRPDPGRSPPDNDEDSDGNGGGGGSSLPTGPAPLSPSGSKP